MKKFSKVKHQELLNDLQESYDFWQGRKGRTLTTTLKKRIDNLKNILS